MAAPRGLLVVTGGSRGIGSATARLASHNGWDICLTYHRDRAAAETIAQDCRHQGRQALAVQADVSNETDVMRLFDQLPAEIGPLGGLVNNAGVVAPQTTVANMTAERIERVLAVNTLGPFLCAREAVRRMSTTLGGSGGTIVNVSSKAAVLGSPNEYVDYAASKAALDTLTVGLAREVADQGIRVNSIRAGLIATDMHGRNGDPGRLERLRTTIPMQREGTATEVAAAILWLLSDEAAYITGAILDVSGGR
jgi:NAD(P)-dependent dehydrogenase (short-subunit alcohol dehydrogenase family)